MDPWVVVGLDNGGTKNNATVLDSAGTFLVSSLIETPSCVQDGPEVAIECLALAFDDVLALTGVDRDDVRAVGLGTPGPASANGVISSKGSTNFSQPAWRSFDVRGALEDRLKLPVSYDNDGNAAALYAHYVRYGSDAAERSSVAAVVGTGLGGGIIESGRVVRGAAGMAGGHIRLALDGLLEDDQPLPLCHCGVTGDAESLASLSAIEGNLLPYWLTRFPDHPLALVASPLLAAKQVRDYAEAGDDLALRIFEQQAMALGRLFTIAANFTDPDSYFVGGGVVEHAPHFRDWFLDQVRQNTSLRSEQLAVADFALVPDRDMAGARGAAISALRRFESGQLSF
jgi:predicted NBD/HSP70 family sugar kinase